MEFAENVPLAPYTTFRIGGPARWFAEAVTEDDILSAVRFARERSLRLFVLGGGSNLLIADSGFDGLVLHIALRGIAREERGARSLYSVAAGENWDDFVARIVAAECAGMECLSGIPGTAGATPVQNVGAYGQEVSQTITSVRVLDLRTLQFVSLGNSECGFTYRRSLFNSERRDRYIVTRVEYALAHHGEPSVAYQDLRRAFQDRTPTLAAVRETVLSIRAGKGMLIVPGDRDSLSAGSFFKNPIVSQDSLQQLGAKTVGGLREIPHFAAGEGQVKIPAAWLLERAGFTKGYAFGNVGISSRHTLALINRGGASADEVIALSDKIVQAVEETFKIRLEPEPIWVRS